MSNITLYIKYKTNKYKIDNIPSIKYIINSIEEINNYDEILQIDCHYNYQLTEFPKLPNSLQIFECWNNQLTSLPKLPNSLIKLYGYYNRLSILPEPPNSLKELHCNGGRFIKTQKYKYLKQFIYL